MSRWRCDQHHKTRCDQCQKGDVVECKMECDDTLPSDVDFSTCCAHKAAMMATTMYEFKNGFSFCAFSMLSLPSVLSVLGLLRCHSKEALTHSLTSRFPPLHANFVIKS